MAYRFGGSDDKILILINLTYLRSKVNPQSEWTEAGEGVLVRKFYIELLLTTNWRLYIDMFQCLRRKLDNLNCQQLEMIKLEVESVCYLLDGVGMTLFYHWQLHY